MQAEAAIGTPASLFTTQIESAVGLRRWSRRQILDMEQNNGYAHYIWAILCFWGLLCVHETCSQRHVQTCSEACSGGFMAISKNTAPVCMNSFSCPAVCKKHPAASRRNHSPRIDLCIILYPIGKIVSVWSTILPDREFYLFCRWHYTRSGI